MVDVIISAALSWMTPTVLFVLLNLVIATIALTSSRGTSAAAAAQSKLSRSPSLVLDRLKSFNLYSYRPIEPQTESIQPTPEPEPEPEEQEQHQHIDRCQSDTKPAGGEIPTKLARKMKKSATMKSAFNHFEFDDGKEEEEEVMVKRPATTRERVEDAEVDSKADDFINRFKQQLKLQRLDSIIRYKEMLTRGAGN